MQFQQSDIRSHAHLHHVRVRDAHQHDRPAAVVPQERKEIVYHQLLEEPRVLPSLDDGVVDEVDGPRPLGLLDERQLQFKVLGIIQYRIVLRRGAAGFRNELC